MTTLEQSWPDPPINPALAADEVHVWRIALNRPIEDVQGLQTLLASEEISRADRFRFEKDRQRFVVVRGLLRVILGRYLDLKPNQLRFVYSDYGKPALARRPLGGSASICLTRTSLRWWLLRGIDSLALTWSASALSPMSNKSPNVSFLRGKRRCFERYLEPQSLRCFFDIGPVRRRI
jgi:hypothetical protein